MRRCISLLAFALCAAAAEAQSIMIDQFHNFATGVPITTNGGGRWDVPIYSPAGGAVQPQQFVTRVEYALTVSSQISFSFPEQPRVTSTITFDPRANLGPSSVNGPMPTMGVVGQLVGPTAAANNSVTPIAYSQVNTQIFGVIIPPPFNPANQLAYNVITIKPIQTGNAITFTFPSGATQTFNKSNSRVTNYSETCTLSGTVMIRYVFVPATFTQICPGSGSAVLGVYGNQTPAGSVLGLSSLAPNTPAVFVRALAPAPMSPSGICLSGPIRMSASVTLANSAGILIRALDGAGPFMSGQTHYFQGWFRVPGATAPS